MEEDIKREIIRANLEGYPLIKRFFGDIIEQRLKINCFSHGMLTASLLSLEELKKDLLALEMTKFDLQRLEIVLQFGNSCCRNLDFICREDKLAQYQDADAKIVDMLAEVKAFEFLCRHDFSEITKIRQKPNAMTVDFTAKRNNQKYAIEVTRLGLPQSDKKMSAHSLTVSTLNYENKCEDADGLEISMIDNELSKERIENDIYDVIDHKYHQLKEFYESDGSIWKVVLFISSGRDYFAARRYENKSYEITSPHTIYHAIGQVWQSLREEKRNQYLHHLVITRGKDLGKAIVSPAIEL